MFKTDQVPPEMEDVLTVIGEARRLACRYRPSDNEYEAALDLKAAIDRFAEVLTGKPDTFPLKRM